MNDLSLTSAFYPSRPDIFLDGEKITDLSEGLLSLIICESNAGLYNCEACFGNWGSTENGIGFLYFDREQLEFGKSIRIEMGDGETRRTIFVGRITAIEGRFPSQQPPQVQILAEDRCQDLRMTRRTRTFEDVDDAEVFEQIAGEHNLQPDIDLDSQQHRTLAQVNLSDLAFLRDRARAIDAEVWIENDTLFAQSRRRRRASTAISLTYGQRLREIEIIADLANQRSSVAVSGWDVSAKETIEEIAEENAIGAELSGGVSGVSILTDTFGERPEQLVHTVPLSSSEARAKAQAQFRSLARRFSTGRAIAQGDGRLRVAAEVDFNGLGPLFDGAYYITEVRHKFDTKNGFLSQISVERPYIGN